MTISWSSTVNSLMPKYGFKIHEQIKTGWTAMKKGAIREMVLKKKNNNIQIDEGHARAHWVADYGTVNRAGKAPVEATYQTKLMISGVTIGLQAHDETESTAEGVQLLQRQLKKTIAGMTSAWAYTAYNSVIETLDASSASTSGASSFTSNAAARYIPGMSYEVINSTTLVEVFTVASRTINTDGTGTVTFTSVSTANYSSGYDVQVEGSEDNGPKGLSDVAGTGTLFGQAGTAYNWQGTAEDASSAAFNKDTLENVEDRRFALCNGVAEAYILCSKRTARKIYRADKDLTGFSASYHDPRGETVLKVDGMEVCVDQHVGDKDVYLQAPDYVLWHTSLKMAPPGSDNKTFQKQSLRLKEDTAEYMYDMRMAGNIRPEMRSCNARYYNYG